MKTEIKISILDFNSGDLMKLYYSSYDATTMYYWKAIPYLESVKVERTIILLLVSLVYLYLWSKATNKRYSKRSNLAS